MVRISQIDANTRDANTIDANTIDANTIDANTIDANTVDANTIDGNVEFVHSKYSCILTSQVSTQFLCPTKFLIKVIILE